MINGVTVLNEELCSYGTTLGHIIFAILFIIVISAGIFILINSIVSRFYGNLRYLIPIIFFSIMLFVLTMATPERRNDTYTKYEVTISDDVSMNEFTDKYTIIEQRGDIYVVKEK